MKKKATAAIFPYIPFERTSPIPFYRQIYEGYRAAILSGRLSPGQRLPSTRALAADLKISRLPIVNAFEQLLVIPSFYRKVVNVPGPGTIESYGVIGGAI